MIMIYIKFTIEIEKLEFFSMKKENKLFVVCLLKYKLFQHFMIIPSRDLNKKNLYVL